MKMKASACMGELSTSTMNLPRKQKKFLEKELINKINYHGKWNGGTHHKRLKTKPRRMSRLLKNRLQTPTETKVSSCKFLKTSKSKA